MDAVKLGKHLSSFTLPDGGVLTIEDWLDPRVEALSDDELLELSLEAITHQIELLYYLEHERASLDHRRRVALVEALPNQFKSVGWLDMLKSCDYIAPWDSLFDPDDLLDILKSVRDHSIQLAALNKRGGNSDSGSKPSGSTSNPPHGSKSLSKTPAKPGNAPKQQQPAAQPPKN